MEINKKAIAVKLSKRTSKNGYIQVRLRNGRFAWIKEKVQLRPWWSLII